MKSIARAATVAGLTVGVGLLALPAASAGAGDPAIANVTLVQLHSVSEEGPGDLNLSQVISSPYASPKVGNKPVKTGHIKQIVKGKKIGPVALEVEGPEQDQGEGA
ncbi:hypothetical protein BZB76_1723 [Actinomadura pelletieri DSM 43383]|uniref:Uncharacterized protein n=1 Tax=Actinomadura pelletieri DSM 43383 TaxID=1120940 RepID=A0A495QS89_9ACTN|nr:hypothetical protein [Actinomadura pelletieri]RKS76369.1 hypothetical protein BZB76_1723 [Actinomadura pelletieri DSM 43383]